MQLADAAQIEQVAALLGQSRRPVDELGARYDAVAPIVVRRVARAVGARPDIAFSVGRPFDGHVGAVTRIAEYHPLRGRLAAPGVHDVEIVLVRAAELHIPDAAVAVDIEALHDGIAHQIYPFGVDVIGIELPHSGGRDARRGNRDTDRGRKIAERSPDDGLPLADGLATDVIDDGHGSIG